MVIFKGDGLRTVKRCIYALVRRSVKPVLLGAALYEIDGRRQTVHEQKSETERRLRRGEKGTASTDLEVKTHLMTRIDEERMMRTIGLIEIAQYHH